MVGERETEIGCPVWDRGTRLMLVFPAAKAGKTQYKKTV